MTQRVRLLKAAAILVLLVAGAELAMAKGEPQQQKPQQPNATNVGSISQRWHGPASAPLPPSRLIAAPLSENECKGLGGVVTVAWECGNKSVCETADANGEIHLHCITE